MKKWRMFTKWTIQTIECVIGAAVILTIFLNINVDVVISENSQSGFWPPILTLFGIYVIVMSFFIIPVSVSTVCASNIPASISVNLRRKDALVGMQMIKIMSSICCMLLGLTAFWAADWPFSDGRALPALELLLCGLCIDIILTSAGNLVMSVSNIFRKMGVFIVSIFFAIIGGSIGVLLSKTMKHGIDELLDFTSFQMPVWVILLTVVILLLDIIIGKKCLDKMESHC